MPEVPAARLAARLAAISILVVHMSLFTGVFDGPATGGSSRTSTSASRSSSCSRPSCSTGRSSSPGSRTGSDPFSEYAKRRFVRIAPAYWAVLTISAIVPGMAGAFSGNWWVYYGLLQSFPVYTPTGACAVDPLRCGIPVAWSLTVEVLFYVIAPVRRPRVAWLGRRWRGRPLTLEFGLVAALTRCLDPDPELGPYQRPATLPVLLADRPRLVVRARAGARCDLRPRLAARDRAGGGRLDRRRPGAGDGRDCALRDRSRTSSRSTPSLVFPAYRASGLLRPVPRSSA